MLKKHSTDKSWKEYYLKQKFTVTKVIKIYTEMDAYPSNTHCYIKFKT